MVSGVIVLATPVGGIPEVIRDGVTGFIIGSTESEKLAEQILRIVEMENLDVVAGNARKYAETRFDFLASTKRFRRILEF